VLLGYLTTNQVPDAYYYSVVATITITFIIIIARIMTHDKRCERKFNVKNSAEIQSYPGSGSENFLRNFGTVAFILLGL
jgi:hypothetical protein